MQFGIGLIPRGHADDACGVHVTVMYVFVFAIGLNDHWTIIGQTSYSQYDVDPANAKRERPCANAVGPATAR